MHRSRPDFHMLNEQYNADGADERGSGSFQISVHHDHPRHQRSIPAYKAINTFSGVYGASNTMRASG